MIKKVIIMEIIIINNYNNKKHCGNKFNNKNNCNDKKYI